MKKILVVNLNLAIARTAAVPRLCKGTIYRLSKVETMPGGKGVNVVRALRFLRQPAKLMGFVAGHNGRWIKQELRRAHMPAECVSFSPGESRVCQSVVDSSDGVPTDFNEEGCPVPQSAGAKFAARFDKTVRNFDLVAFCGRISPGVGDSYFKKLIGIARKHGKMTAIDTSGGPLRASFDSGVNLFKMNRSEFEEACGEALTPKSVARFFSRVAKCGTEYVVVTDGPFPTLAVTKENLWKFYPPRIKVITPIGAGDSFMAGLLYGVSNGLSRQDCAKMALGAAASDCRSLGPGVITGKECFAFADRARLERLPRPLLGEPYGNRRKTF